MKASRHHLATAAALFLLTGAARGQQQSEGLRYVWGEADHPSGVYHAKATGQLAVVVENPTTDGLPLKGSVAFGMLMPAAGDRAAVFKPLSVTPVKDATVGPGERVRLPISVTFGAAGTYQLRWVNGEDGAEISNSAGVTLQCIFAPRTGVRADERWITALPPIAAQVPGYLADLLVQTGVRKYVLEESFAFDPQQNVALAMGASLGVPTEQVDALLRDAVKGKAELVLRVRTPISSNAADGRVLAAFHRYITDAMRRGQGTIRGIVVVPSDSGGEPVSPEVAQRVYERFYLAAYQAAKAADPGVVMLGTGSEPLTRRWLLEHDLHKYLDGIAVADAFSAAASQRESKLPVWVLPPLPSAARQSADEWAQLPPAASLGEGAAVVALPPPGVDRGVAAHLLGGAVVYQKLHATTAGLPYGIVFQGDGYAVAAMAGLASGTPIDTLFPQFAPGQTVVTGTEENESPPYPHWEVGDDTGSLRVVDAGGSPVDCRRGDTLYVPSENRVVYVLAGGSAEDLLSLLKAGMPGKLPVAALTAFHGDGDTVTLRVTNITESDIGGTVRLLAPGSNTPLAEKKLVPVSPGHWVEIPLDVTELPPGNRVVAEVTTEGSHGVVQRTLLPVTPAERKP